MINSLKLGNKLFPINLIQGPLAGVSCSAFRYLTWKYSQPAFTCTEMISCKTLIHQPQLSFQRYMNKHPLEGPVCYQLSSNNPSEIAEAAKIVTDHGADLIDLNCGCPVKKIRAKGAGSRLLTEPKTLYQLIVALKSNTHLPVSIKIRVQSNSDEKFNQEVASIVTDAGADFVIVHGRHWTEHYETPCNYQQIQFFVETLNIPVIGNGDIKCLSSLKKMLDTGCAGVMISRAGVGQPWLIGKLFAEYHQEKFIEPAATEVGLIFVAHIQNLASLLGNEHLAILQARKLARYYARRLTHKNEFCEKINGCKDFKAFTELCYRYFR